MPWTGVSSETSSSSRPVSPGTAEQETDCGELLKGGGGGGAIKEVGASQPAYRDLGVKEV